MQRLKEQLIILCELGVQEERQSSKDSVEWGIHKGYVLGLTAALGALQDAQEDMEQERTLPIEGGLFTEEQL
jgi:hypothetical protein